ncbi:YtxH domain-containing protein [Actinomycetota bacterium]
MTDQTKPEVPEKKSTNKGSGGKIATAVAVALFSGVAIGLATGLLFAPKKGQKTRKEIADKSKELYEKGKGTLTGTIDKTKEFTKESKSKFDKVIDIMTPKKKKEEK